MHPQFESERGLGTDMSEFEEEEEDDNDPSDFFVEAFDEEGNPLGMLDSGEFTDENVSRTIVKGETIRLVLGLLGKPIVFLVRVIHRN